MNKKRLIIICAAIVSVILIVLTSILVYHFNKNDDEIVIYDNVYVLSETENVIDVGEDTISFSKDMGYKEGDIIVSGITDKSPDGFIRKVVSVENNNGIYSYVTEPAVLTEVFKEAHFSNKIQLLDDSSDVVGLTYTEKTSDSYNSIISLSNTRSTLVYRDTTPSIFLLGEKTDSREMLIKKEFETDIEDEIKLSGEVGLDIWIEIAFDIKKGNIDFSLISNYEFLGEILLQCESSLFDKDKDEGEWEHLLFGKQLPNIQFFIGYIPVVITNDFKATLDTSVQLEGELGTTVSIDSNGSNGFKYSSRTGKVEEINERKYISDGLEWKANASSNGNVESGVYSHLITQLYGCTGVDVSVGVVGGVSGEVELEVDYLEATTDFSGELELYIKPKVKGKLVVSVPIIDKKLKESELFTISLKPLWSKKWSKQSNNHSISLDNTYTTKYATVTGTDEPTFKFDYPNDWKITKEDVADNDAVEEWVEITKDNLKITYISFPNSLAFGRNWVDAEAEEVAKSSLVAKEIQGYDYSSIGNFVVAKIHETRYTHLDSSWNPQELDRYFYAVIPKSDLGEIGYANRLEVCEFYFIGKWHHYSLFVESDNDKFTAEEEKEIVAILQSFRVKK